MPPPSALHQTQANLENLNAATSRRCRPAKAAYRYDEARFGTPSRRSFCRIVEVLDVRPGRPYRSKYSVATLLEKDQIYVRIYIPETEYGRLKLGQKAEVRVDSFPNTVF